MKTFICIVILFLSQNSFSQQWSGSATTSDPIVRNGNVVIQAENSGIIVDEGVHQRVGFIKYPGKYAGIWRNPNSFFEIGRVTGSITSPTGYTTDFFIGETGNIGIGTTIPGSFKLAVEGKIGAREIKVTLQNPWPDYVFNPQYKLLDLRSFELFIHKNNHLPGIPSAAEVNKSGGIDLGVMNVKLLEKVEELALYIIELNKKLQAQQIEIELLKKNISLKN